MIKTTAVAALTTLIILLAPWQVQAGKHYRHQGTAVIHGHHGWHSHGRAVQRHAHRPRHNAAWRLQRKKRIYWSDGYLSRWELRDLRRERRWLFGGRRRGAHTWHGRR